MYTFLRSLSRRELLVEQPAVLAASLLVAELFYKFGSFLLECVAFLLTWLVLDATVAGVRALVQGRTPSQGTSG
jgi:hypothetical protein